LIDRFFNILLTIQVKGTGRCSNKTLGLNEHWLSPGTLHTGFNGWALDSISFTNDDDFFPF
jgi:hypothetical protein